jgi:preprotein translocase subunit SecE
VAKTDNKPRTRAKSKAKAKGRAKKDNVIVRYVKDTRNELQKVSWPSRQETVRLTQIVMIVTFSVGMFLWLADLLFSWWLGGVLIADPWRIGMIVVALVATAVVTLVISRRHA